MEFYHDFPSVTFGVGRGEGPLEQQKQDSNVCRRNRAFHLILRKNQNPHYKDDKV